MSTVIRDVVVRLAIEQAASEVKAPDFSATETALAEIEQRYADVGIAANTLGEKGTAGAEDIADTLSGLSGGVDDFKESLFDAQVATAQSLGTMGEGAFKLTRGIAFLSASSEEDLQAMMDTISQAQGAFDAFTGGRDAILGAVEAFRSMRTASAIAAAGNTTVAASNVAVTGTATTATGALAAMNVAMGPIGWTIAGLAVGVGALAIAWRFFDDADDSVNEVTDALEREANQIERVASQQKQLIEIQKIRRDTLIATGSDATRFIDDESKKLAILAEQQSQLEKFTFAPIEIVDSVAEVKAHADELERLADAKQDALNKPFATMSVAMSESPEEMRLRATEDLERAHENYIDSLEAGVSRQRAELEHADSIKEKIAERINVTESLIEKQEKVTASMFSQIDAAKDLIRIEENRNKSFEETVGSLDAGEFRQFQRIGRQVERKGFDSLNREEAGFIQSRFGRFEEFQNMIGNRNERIGERRGAVDVAGMFGVNLEGRGSRLDAARQAEAAARRQATDALNASGESDAELIDAAQQMADRQSEIKVQLMQSFLQAASTTETMGNELKRITQRLFDAENELRQWRNASAANGA